MYTVSSAKSRYGNIAIAKTSRFMLVKPYRTKIVGGTLSTSNCSSVAVATRKENAIAIQDGMNKNKVATSEKPHDENLVGMQRVLHLADSSIDEPRCFARAS